MLALMNIQWRLKATEIFGKTCQMFQQSFHAKKLEREELIYAARYIYFR